MSHAIANKKAGGRAPDTHRIRIKLLSKNVRNLEEACNEFIAVAHAEDLKVRGPVRMPTKHLKITTHKSPCGEGTTTFDKFEMMIHSRLIELNARQDVVKRMNKIHLKAGVDCEVTIASRR